MKRIITALFFVLTFFIAKNVQAQFGISIGYSPEFIKGKSYLEGQLHPIKSTYRYQGLYAGLYYNFYLLKNFGITVEGHFRWRHAHYTMIMDLDSQTVWESYTNIYYFEIPVLPNYSFIIKQNFKLSLFLGPTLEYGLGGSIKTHTFGGSYSYDLTTHQFTYEEESWTEQKCFDSGKFIDRFHLYGLTGIAFSYRHINLSTSYRYGFFNKNDTKMHASCIYLGIGYCF